MPKVYPFAVEFSADFGMFSRPDSGSESCSYVVPTRSAARGMIESICWLKYATVEIAGCGICFEPSWTNYAFNSFASSRKTKLVNTMSPSQIRTSILVKPRFIILGYAMSKVQMPGLNHAHSFSCQLARRVRFGRYHSRPVMGWKDFPVTDCTTPKTPLVDYNCVVPTLCDVSYSPSAEVITRFSQNVPIVNGVLSYGNEPVENRDGFLTFKSEELDFLTKKFIKEAIND